ncbi:MAG: flagellar basal body rod protein FlgC [Pseudomonadota bacterium]
MSDMIPGMSAAASGMTAQSARLRITAENIANADTPGYRRKLVSFEEMTRRADDPRAVAAGRITLDRSDLERIYDPAHPLADGSGYYDGSNVSLIIEIADSREAQRGYEANLRMFDQSRRMMTSLLDLLRR